MKRHFMTIPIDSQSGFTLAIGQVLPQPDGLYVVAFFTDVEIKFFKGKPSHIYLSIFLQKVNESVENKDKDSLLLLPNVVIKDYITVLKRTKNINSYLNHPVNITNKKMGALFIPVIISKVSYNKKVLTTTFNAVKVGLNQKALNSLVDNYQRTHLKLL